jgi:hypothetical protein
MSLWLLIGSLLAADAQPPDPAELARRIDQRLTARLEAERVPSAVQADDAEFLRRVHLDLIGRIPTPGEARAFLADNGKDKRRLLIGRLLSNREHARHFARVWRGLLLPEAETEPQVRYFQPGFEAWLEERRFANAGFDAIVGELLTVPIARPDETPEFVLREMRKPNPLAFIAAKNAEPAKIASSAVRLFLGLRLECAQCHDHPFDNWTRKQFWNQAAFFAGIERRGKGTFSPLVEAVDGRPVRLMDGAETAPALFLDLSSSPLDGRQSPRIALARWMTSPENPYFAQAIVNRVWSQLMGTGIVEPVDDFRESNSPSHPELLTDLATAFTKSGFDVTHLVRAICLSDAYQRTSRQTHESQARTDLFARMAIKSLSSEQFLDSLAQAIGYETAPAEAADEGDENPLGRRVLGLFADDGQPGEPETSVTQALALMNGNVIQRAVTPETGKRLQSILEQFPESFEEQVEALYLATLSRPPDDSEKRTLDAFFSRREAVPRARRLGDVFWMLLNSPEFRWNH